VKHIDEDSVSPGDVLTFYRCDPATGDCMLIEGSTTTGRVAAEPGERPDDAAAQHDCFLTS
jgi:hypothetical protein